MTKIVLYFLVVGGGAFFSCKLYFIIYLREIETKLCLVMQSNSYLSRFKNNYNTFR